MAAFAKLIPNVRAISGALRETDDDGKRTADSLEHLHEMTVAAFNEKYKLFIDSDAQKTLTEMNKLKTFLTTDLGAAIVQAVNQFLGFVGGADALGAAIKALVPVLWRGRDRLRRLRRGNGRNGDERPAGGLGARSPGSCRQRSAGGADGLCRLRLRQHPDHPEHPPGGRGFPQRGNGAAGYGPGCRAAADRGRGPRQPGHRAAGRTKPWPSSAKTTSRWWTTPRRTTSG